MPGGAVQAGDMPLLTELERGPWRRVSINLALLTELSRTPRGVRFPGQGGLAAADGEAGSLRYGALRRRTHGASVAQVSKLLCRGFPIRWPSLRPECQVRRTVCRLEVGDTADLEVCATALCAAGRTALPWRRFQSCCVADFRSAGRPFALSARCVGRSADWKSAIRQTWKSALRRFAPPDARRFRGAGFKAAVSRISDPLAVPSP